MRDQETDAARQAKKERGGNKTGERQKARGNCEVEKGADPREKRGREPAESLCEGEGGREARSRHTPTCP